MKNKNRTMFTTLHKTKSKWIKDLEITQDLINLIKDKVGNALEHIGTGDNFLNRTPMEWLML